MVIPFRAIAQADPAFSESPIDTPLLIRHPTKEDAEDTRKGETLGANWNLQITRRC